VTHSSKIQSLHASRFGTALAQLNKTMIGATLDSYTVRNKLGEGGMGTVYMAEHAVLGRKAAIKLLRPELSGDREIVMRFLNEARAASAIHHPAIVEIFDFGFAPELGAFLVMELLEGETLHARRVRLGRFEPSRALVIARQIAGGLAAAHELGVVHRDLKPENVFVIPDPEVVGGERIKLLDFGIAKLQGQLEDASLTTAGSVLGTPTYMAPEQCRSARAVDARADLYALGCVLYELVCGRPPFVADGSGDLIAHHLYFEPVAPRQLDPALPEDIDELVMWMMRKDPARRPQSARELIDAIARIERGAVQRAAAPTQIAESIPATPAITTLSRASGQSTRKLRHHRSPWLIAALASLGSLAIAGRLAALVAWPPGAQTDEAVAIEQSPAPRAPATAPASTALDTASPLPVASPTAPPAMTRLTIDSDPTAATVVCNGKVVGTTPFVDTVERRSRVRSYTIQKAGYQAATVVIATDGDATHRIVLNKKPSTHSRPALNVGDKGVNPFGS
jgi:serine/threonine-protein kinase